MSLSRRTSLRRFRPDGTSEPRESVTPRIIQLRYSRPIRSRFARSFFASFSRQESRALLKSAPSLPISVTLGNIERSSLFGERERKRETSLSKENRAFVKSDKIGRSESIVISRGKGVKRILVREKELLSFSLSPSPSLFPLRRVRTRAGAFPFSARRTSVSDTSRAHTRSHTQRRHTQTYKRTAGGGQAGKQAGKQARQTGWVGKKIIATGERRPRTSVRRWVSRMPRQPE